MSADTVEPLSKVDSAVSGLSSSPPDDKGAVKGHRRASSSAAGVWNINDLGQFAKANDKEPPRCFLLNLSQRRAADKCIEKEGKELQIAKETQRLNW